MTEEMCHIRGERKKYFKIWANKTIVHMIIQTKLVSHNIPKYQLQTYYFLNTKRNFFNFWENIDKCVCVCIYIAIDFIFYLLLFIISITQMNLLHM